MSYQPATYSFTTLAFETASGAGTTWHHFVYRNLLFHDEPKDRRLTGAVTKRESTFCMTA